MEEYRKFIGSAVLRTPLPTVVGTKFEIDTDFEYFEFSKKLNTY